jgi:hypothetical protein
MNTTVLTVAATVCRLVGALGEDYRAAFGRWLVGYINRTGLAQIPSSDIFDPAESEKTVQQVRAALDEPYAGGGRGGWKSALALIYEKRKQAVPLLALPEQLAITLLMGIPGRYTPVTVFTAQQRISDIKQQYHETGQPDFLYRIAHAEAVRQLTEADAKPGYLGAGCLKALFDARRNPDKQLGERMREKAVLMYMQQIPEYRKFLGRDQNDNYVLPAGDSYETFAANMLRNAYGEFPGV